jgi:hypothetical protein
MLRPRPEFGQKQGDVYLWRMPKDELLATLSEALGEPFEIDDYGEMESYNFREHMVELQYRLGRLDAFNFGSSLWR